MFLRFFAILFLSVSLSHGASLAADGFPTGQDSPEGVAADLARAFINRDYALFDKICLPLYGSKESLESYRQFRDGIKKMMAGEVLKKEPSPGGPKSIGKVFAARELTRDGPASYGYAAFGFSAVQFVDVGVRLVNGDTHTNRTLVVLSEGKWFVHPMPSMSPLLCMGLFDESKSELDWTEKGKPAKTAVTAP